MAIAMLAQRGFNVIAVTGKPHLTEELKGLGASQVSTPEQLELGKRPLEKAKFGGAIDNVGGDLLAGLIRHIEPWGNIACVGLAGGAGFTTTVMPMILRGVSLLGISSTNCPMPLRHKLWQRLASDLKPHSPLSPLSLDRMITETVGLLQLDQVFEAMLARKTKGRILVDLKKN